MADKNEVRVGGIWFCKIGEHSPLQRGADSPMRDAVAAEYKKLTGQEPAFIFSGWGGELTEGERAVVENRLPPTPPADAALADELLRLAGAFDTSLNNAASVSMNKRAADSLRETLIDAAAALRARAVPDGLMLVRDVGNKQCANWNYQAGWNDCRDAMLAAAKEAGR